jgi:PTH1 family peptidyl-tRNA hydrolase
MKLIAGLGNPGKKYEDTRHNVGFMIVEKLVKNATPGNKQSQWSTEEKFKAEVCKLEDVIVVKPQTFMNLSGESISAIAAYYKVEPQDVWVVHDDIDLPLGKIRIRKGGASGGHRGVDSTIENLGTPDFIRFRMGIGRGKMEIRGNSDENLPRQEVEKFVVSPFTEHEAGDVKKLIKHGAEALETAIEKGIEKTMSQFN